VNYPIQEIGARAVDCLIAHIKGEEAPHRVLLTHDIIERESI
jgi:DNA-binding LacI/PurR family transcriptional regulator